MHATVTEAEIAQFADALLGLPIVPPVSDVARATGWSPAYLESVIDAAESSGWAQRWDECPDGPSVVMGVAAVSSLGLSMQGGRWVKEGEGRPARERAGRGREVVATDLVADNAWDFLDSFPSDVADAATIAVTAEDEAEFYREDEAIGQAERDAWDEAERLARARFVPAHTNLIGGGMAWYFDDRQVGTERKCFRRDVRWGQMRERGVVLEYPVKAKACPGCGGVRRAGVFCLRCSG